MGFSPLKQILILSILALLSACSSTSETIALTPLPSGPVDPDDHVMRESVMSFLSETGAPLSSLYEYQRLDLDQDGRRDALVLFKNPYGYWCDLHGCTMLVLRAHDNSFELVNAIQPVRAPLYISETESNGWKSLIIRVTGRWNESKDVAMMYDGQKYPDNPAALPPYTRLASVPNETRVFR